MQEDAEKSQNDIPKEPKHKHKWDQGDEGPIEIDDMQDISQPDEIIDLDAVEDQAMEEGPHVIEDTEVTETQNLCDLGFAPPEEEIEPYDQQVISPPAYDDLDEEEKNDPAMELIKAERERLENLERENKIRNEQLQDLSKNIVKSKEGQVVILESIHEV